MTMSYEDLVTFHGHSCVGCALGFRGAKIALQKGFKRARDEELITIVENKSCSVDAFQFFLGCTFGKGNLFFRDYGKQVFTVVERDTGKALRISLRSGVLRPLNTSGKEDKIKTKEDVKRYILGASDEELFKIYEFRLKEDEIPNKARIHTSISCEACGEPTMETKTVNIDGKTYCIPCADQISKRREML